MNDGYDKDFKYMKERKRKKGRIGAKEAEERGRILAFERRVNRGGNAPAKEPFSVSTIGNTLP